MVGAPRDPEAEAAASAYQSGSWRYRTPKAPALRRQSRSSAPVEQERIARLMPHGHDDQPIVAQDVEHRVRKVQQYASEGVPHDRKCLGIFDGARDPFLDGDEHVVAEGA